MTSKPSNVECCQGTDGVTGEQPASSAVAVTAIARRHSARHDARTAPPPDRLRGRPVLPRWLPDTKGTEDPTSGPAAASAPGASGTLRACPGEVAEWLKALAC